MEIQNYGRLKVSKYKNIKKKLHQLISDMAAIPHIIALSETWTTENSFFKPSLPGYNYIFAFSENRSGGVAFFIISEINFTIRNDLKFKTNGCENLWLETKHNNIVTVIGVVYRHPST